MTWETLHNQAERLMNAWDPDPDHARQVCHLAQLLYHQLTPLHELNNEQRTGLPAHRILTLAAMLHDTGWTAPGNRGHHKKSRDRILNAEIKGLSNTDRILIAQIARYHRKRHPDPLRHFIFAELPYEDQTLVRWLSAILRIADGLDRAHTSDVDDLQCDIQSETIIINIYCNTGSATAIYGANRKKALLQEITQRTVTIDSVQKARR